jgi:uncharacterized membrane protein HdeD (DUF308 family)
LTLVNALYPAYPRIRHHGSDPRLFRVRFSPERFPHRVHQFSPQQERIMSTATANERAFGSSPPPFGLNTMSRTLARNWWLIALRGLLGALFGLIALFFPGPTILSLVLLFSAYMLVDGLFSLYAAGRAAFRHERWGVLLLQGLASIATGAIAFLWPGITVLAFVLLIAAWSIVSGCLMLAAASRLAQDHGRWWLALGGVASLIFGILMILAPLAGAIVLTWWIGAYALVFGVALIVLAFKLRAHRADHPSVAAARPA